MRVLALVTLVSPLTLAGCCDSGIIGASSSGHTGLSSTGATQASASTGGSTGSPIGSTSGAGASTGSTGGAATGSTGGVQSTSGGNFDAGAERCDQAYVTWTGPTANTDGSCLYDLQAFTVVWGLASGGPYGSGAMYPGALDVGLPCTAGPTVSCGDGGSVVQLNCAFLLGGLADGLTDFAVEAVGLNGTSAPSSPQSKTIACGAGVGSPCQQASDCPPYLACGRDAGACTNNSFNPGDTFACDSDSQCMLGWQQGGLGTTATCLNGLCAAGCVSTTDCGIGSCCDLTSGSPGTCVLPPALPSSQCLCAIDDQCNGFGGQQGEPSYGNICAASGVCAPGCKTGLDCPANAACDLSQGFPGTCAAPCLGDQCSCVSPGQCGGGVGQQVTCLSTGLCGSGCGQASDCPSTETCDLLNQQCSSTCPQSNHPSDCLCDSNSQCAAGVAGSPAYCAGTSCYDAG